MHSLFRTLLVLCVLPFAAPPENAAHAQTEPRKHGQPFITKIWTVKGYAGEAWRLNPEAMVGKSQNFRKDWAKGSFFDCIYGGLSSTHTTYTLDEFLENREFRLFSRYREKLALTEQVVFVHRLSCARGLRVLYPFVTFEPRGRAMLLFDGLVFIFE